MYETYLDISCKTYIYGPDVTPRFLTRDKEWHAIELFQLLERIFLVIF